METTIKKRRRKPYRVWGDLTFIQKRHYLIAFLKISRFRYWYYCGKNTQKYYLDKPLDEDNINSIRDKIFSDYCAGLERFNPPDKDKKIAKAKKYLYATEKEN